MPGLKKIIGGFLLCLSGVLTFSIFWEEQARFLAPTPVPESYVPVSVGTQPDLSKWEVNPENDITLLHFYNPDCPCSRFNRDHLKKLITFYQDRVNFVVVVQNKQDRTELPDAFENAHAVYDPEGEIADRCGVYSTPQAILLDEEGKIIYRGNYNMARYCTSRDTWFTEMVIKAKLAGKPIPVLPDLAYQAYGCNLPSDKSGPVQDQFSMLFFNF